MILAHVIALDPTAAQEAHFRKACGVARLAYNAQMPTCGDMEALAVEQSATKLPWMHRKLDRRTHVRTN